MSRWTTGSLAVAAATGSLALAVAVPTYQRELRPASAPGALGVFEPDGLLLARDPTLRTLRISRADGTLVPFRPAPPPAAPTALLGRRIAGGTTAAGLLSVDFDLGASQPTDAVVLDLAAAGRFLERADLLASSDRRTWRAIASATVYSIPADPASGTLGADSSVIRYSPTDERYLRVVVRKGDIRDITGLRAEAVAEASTPLLVDRPAAAIVRSSEERTTALLDLGAAVPVTRLVVTTSQPRFDRAYTVFAVGADGTPTPVASGRIYRYGPGDVGGTIDVAVTARTLRLRIDDGADAPLPDLRVRAFDASHAQLLDRPGLGVLTLRYADPAGAPGSFEFARLPLAPEAVATATRYILGAESVASTRTPRQRSGLPHWVVPAVVTLGVLIVAGVCLLVLRAAARRDRATR